MSNTKKNSKPYTAPLLENPRFYPPEISTTPKDFYPPRVYINRNQCKIMVFLAAILVFVVICAVVIIFVRKHTKNTNPPLETALEVHNRHLQIEFSSSNAHNLERSVSVYTKPNGRFWSVYVPCGPDSTIRTLKNLNLVFETFRKFSDRSVIVYEPMGFDNARERNKIGYLLGVRDHGIGYSVQTLKIFYELGIRYVDFSSDDCRSLGTPGDTSFEDENGLTEFGKRIVSEMNKMGMMVVLSHVSRKTWSSVFNVSQVPFLISDASFEPHLVPPTQISNFGGVVLVTLNETGFTVSEVADRIDELRNLCGIDHVGYGFPHIEPFGYPGPRYFDSNKFLELTAELLRRGYDENDLAKLIGGNVRRVLHAVQYRTFDNKA